ncbi:MAG: helix-turn-helix transcriptional regulator [Bacillota bacterium]|nr:helix-turn-helix transcriptional regulator [Bacillota bacterium]
MEVLRRIRELHGLNKTQMAHKLGITKSYYTMLEKGERPVSKRVALAAYEAFGVPLELLLVAALRPHLDGACDDQAAQESA